MLCPQSWRLSCRLQSEQCALATFKIATLFSSSGNNWFNVTSFLWTKCTIAICWLVCLLACLALFSSFPTIACVNYIAFKIKTGSNQSCFQRAEILSSSQKPDRSTSVDVSHCFPLLCHTGMNVSGSHARELYKCHWHVRCPGCSFI